MQGKENRKPRALATLCPCEAKGRFQVSEHALVQENTLLLYGKNSDWARFCFLARRSFTIGIIVSPNFTTPWNMRTGAPSSRETGGITDSSALLAVESLRYVRLAQNRRKIHA